MAHSVTEWIVESAKKHFSSHGPGISGEIVRGAIKAKKFKPDRLNLRELAELSLGRHTFEARLAEYGRRAGWVSESTEAVDLSIFRNIVQANVGAVQQEVYADSVSVVDQLIGSDPDDAGMDPMATRLNPVAATATDPPRDVAPNTDYPRTSFGPYYTTAPIADKVGLIAVLGLEMVKANQVRRWIDANKEVARKVAIEERKRKLRVILGITNNYSRNGTSYNTYLTSGDRVNSIVNLNLTNGPGEIDRVMQAFDSMTNPFTGEPMDAEPTQILTTRGNVFELKSMLGADEMEITNAGGVTTTPNPIQFGGPVMTDRYVYNLLVAERGLSAAEAASWMAIGDFQRAFKWREIEPFHTFEVGPNDEAWPPHFFQDIVYATKSRFWGVGYVNDPFAVVEAFDED